MLVSDNPSGKSWQNKALKFYPKADYERMGSSVWKVHLTELWGKKQQSSRVALWLLICVVQQILLTQSTRSTLNLLHNISQLFPNCQQTSHLRSSWSVWSPKSQKMMCSMRFCITISNITFPTAVNYWWTERMHFLNKFWLQFCAHIWESWKVNFFVLWFMKSKIYYHNFMTRPPPLKEQEKPHSKPGFWLWKMGQWLMLTATVWLARRYFVP